MFRFDRKQEVFDFGKFKIGGQPGEYPTCCIGTMFYADKMYLTQAWSL
jgi:tetrahydromethanopterin S-methyltransferase subunit H